MADDRILLETHLPKVKSPTLLIVGGLDYPVIRMNEDAYSQLRCEKELKIAPGATNGKPTLYVYDDDIVPTSEWNMEGAGEPAEIFPSGL